MSSKLLRRKIRRASRRLLRKLMGGAGHKHRVNIALIHVGRCGSTVLCRMLDEHDEVHWAAEFFERFFRESERYQSSKLINSIFNFNPMILLQDKQESRKAEVFGFEFKPYQIRMTGMTFDEFVKALDDMNFTHFITLDRSNRLRTIVSHVFASEAGDRYHINNAEDAAFRSIHLKLDAVRIDHETKPLMQILDDYDSQFRQLNDALSGRDVLKLSYETDIEDDPRKAYIKVCEFIGIEPRRDARVKLRKTMPFPLSELIDNYDEVSEQLAGTRYKWMLDS